MIERKIPFTLDRHEKKILGVCSGLGRTLNVDPTFIRIAFVAVPLLTPVDILTAVIAYLICGIIGAAAAKRSERRRSGLSDFERMEQSGRGHTSIHDLRTRMEENDRRMMAIDHHLNAQNHDLAREIEALRKEDTK